MRPGLQHLAPPLVLIMLASCAGLSQIQSAVTQFDQSAHTIDSQQATFFQDIRNADCANQFFAANITYSFAHGPLPPLNGSCQTTLLTSQQIETRQAALDAISLYADRIQTLAQGSNANLDASAESLVSTLNKHLPHAAGGVAADVETAIIELANIALDQARYRDIKSAAEKAKTPIETVVNDLKAENTGFAQGIDSKLGGIEVSVTTAVKNERPGTSRYFNVINARNALILANPFPQSFGSAQTGATAMAQQLNAELDALVKANNALATADNGAILAAVNDLVARVKDAQAIHSKLIGK